ncbi:hypothetical protein AB1Y20_022499 [Prymnesium parvum]|uniref:Uncharacterized protein n=1 Tax=Prymnesium parvum TaxID=97485 RepID=A0AB34JHD9_PRYPA
MASAAPTLNMQVDDEGIQEIEAHIGITAQATHIPASKLRSWLQRILNSWELMWHDFRLRDDAKPSLVTCVAPHSTFQAVGTAAAVMRAELGAELRGSAPSSAGRLGRTHEARATRALVPESTRTRAVVAASAGSDRVQDAPRVEMTIGRRNWQPRTGNNSCQASLDVPEAFHEIKRRYATKGASSSNAQA